MGLFVILSVLISLITLFGLGWGIYMCREGMEHRDIPMGIFAAVGLVFVTVMPILFALNHC